MRALVLGGVCLGSLLCATLGARAQAKELTPELAAQINEEQRAALEKVNKAHGDKKSSELSQDERRAIIQEQAAADKAVLEQHGVSAKDFARYTATEPLADRAREKAELDRLEAKKADQVETPTGPEGATGGAIEIERGLPSRPAGGRAAHSEERDHTGPRHKKKKHHAE